MKNNQFEKGDILYRPEIIQTELQNKIRFPKSIDIQILTVVDIENDKQYGERTVLRNETTNKTKYCGLAYSSQYGLLSKKEAIDSIVDQINNTIKVVENRFGVSIDKLQKNIHNSVDKINEFLDNLFKTNICFL
jgi:hypothetical protein